MTPLRSDLLNELDRLTDQNRVDRNLTTEKRIRELRHEAFAASRGLELAPLRPPPTIEFDCTLGVPCVEREVTADVARAAILEHGSLIVRGLLSRDRAEQLRETAEQMLSTREQSSQLVEPQESPWYSEAPWAKPDVRKSLSANGMMADSGVMVADSPRGLFQLFELFRETGIDSLASSVIGSRPAISIEKTIFRRVFPQPMPSWHQDGAFLGERIRAFNVWIALSHCGRRAPGLEIFPRRVDRVLPTGCFFTWDLAYDVIQENYPGVSRISPDFAPGDAVLFDQLCAHRTGSEAGLCKPRHALECWFFAPPDFPDGYAGLLV